MARALALLVAAAAGFAVAEAQDCAAKLGFDDCVTTPYCGWCSPTPIVFKNHSTGSRCADQRDKATWDCPGVYTTEKCTMGYNCNATMNYTCTAAGTGEGAFHSQDACTSSACQHSAATDFAEHASKTWQRRCPASQLAAAATAASSQRRPDCRPAVRAVAHCDQCC